MITVKQALFPLMLFCAYGFSAGDSLKELSAADSRENLQFFNNRRLYLKEDVKTQLALKNTITQRWFSGWPRGESWIMRAAMQNIVPGANITCEGVAKFKFNNKHTLIEVSNAASRFIYDFNGTLKKTDEEDVQFIPDSTSDSASDLVQELKKVRQECSQLNPISSRQSNDKKLVINHKERVTWYGLSYERSIISIYDTRGFVPFIGHMQDMLAGKLPLVQVLLWEALRQAQEKGEKMVVSTEEMNIIEGLSPEFKGAVDFFKGSAVVKEKID